MLLKWWRERKARLAIEKEHKDMKWLIDVYYPQLENDKEMDEDVRHNELKKIVERVREYRAKYGQRPN